MQWFYRWRLAVWCDRLENAMLSDYDIDNPKYGKRLKQKVAHYSEKCK